MIHFPRAPRTSGSISHPTAIGREPISPSLTAMLNPIDGACQRTFPAIGGLQPGRTTFLTCAGFKPTCLPDSTEDKSQTADNPRRLLLQDAIDAALLPTKSSL